MYPIFVVYKAERRNYALRQVESKKDIEFYKYERQLSANSEQDLLRQAECLKMDNSDVLEEYKFLHPAIRMICPCVFESANHKLQREIVKDSLIRDHQNRLFAEISGGIYVGNAYRRKPKDPSKTIVYDYKNKKKVPYKTYMDNRMKGRKEKNVKIDMS
jgi:hypothetical protein